MSTLALLVHLFRRNAFHASRAMAFTSACVTGASTAATCTIRPLFVPCNHVWPVIGSSMIEIKNELAVSRFPLSLLFQVILAIRRKFRHLPGLPFILAEILDDEWIDTRNGQ